MHVIIFSGKKCTKQSNDKWVKFDKVLILNMQYIWQSANLIEKKWYPCFNFQFSNYEWSSASSHVFIDRLYFWTVGKDKGREGTKPACGLTWSPASAWSHSLLWTMYYTTEWDPPWGKGGLLFYTPWQSVTGKGWRWQVGKLSVEMAPAHLRAVIWNLFLLWSH